MKRLIRTIIAGLVILILACAPTSVKTPVEVDTGEKLFDTAESLFQEKSYQKALDTFRAYLLSYPDRPRAPAALLKIGEIYLVQGEAQKAREIFSRLIEEYPDSSFVYDARIELLATLYHERKFEQVIRLAAEIPKDQLSQHQAVRLYAILGDSSMSLNVYEDAFYFFGRAMDEAAQQEKVFFRSKVKEIVGQLTPEAMFSLLDRFQITESRGYLLYTLGFYQAEQERYEEAIRLLTELTETLPDHEVADPAMKLIDELKIKILYGVKKKQPYTRHTLGCMLPLSGPYKIYGNRALKGLELAMNQFNADTTDSDITVLIKDTRSDSDRALEAVAELSEENVAAIIGPIITAVPAAFEAQDREIPIITLTQRDTIPMIGDYVLRNFITPKMQVETLVPYAVQVLGVDRFAVLYPKEPYGVTFMNLFWDAVLANGGKIVASESYDPSFTDFADSIKKLVGLYYEIPEDLKPEPLDYLPEDSYLAEDVKPEEEQEPEAIVDFGAIFIPDAPKKAGLVIPQLAYYDIEGVHLLGTNLWHSRKLIQMAGQYTKGAFMADGFFLESASEPVRNFSRKFQEIYKETPGFIEAVVYDTAMLLFQTVSRPEIDSRDLLKDALLNITSYPGVSGLTSFDENGDAQKRLYLLRIRGNKFVEVAY